MQASGKFSNAVDILVQHSCYNWGTFDTTVGCTPVCIWRIGIVL